MTEERSRDPLKVRDAEPEELDSISRLTLLAYAEYAGVMEPAAWAGLRESVITALASDGEVERIVADLDGRIVGSVMLSPPRTETYGGMLPALPWPEIRILAVDPAVRGRGVGTALMRECLRRAARLGVSRVGIHTSKSMAAAREIYRRMSFVRAPEYDFQPLGGELVEAFTLDLANVGT